MEFDVNFLNTTKQVAETTVVKIDESNFLELNLGSVTRLELFLYAMAIGSRKPLVEMQNRSSFIRGEDLRKHPDAIALITSLKIGAKKDFESLESALENKEIGIYAEKCANIGFMIIDDLIETHGHSNDYLKFIEELDDLFDENVKEIE